MISTWENLSLRERVLIGGGIVFLIGILLYSNVFRPLHQNLVEKRNATQAQYALLTDLTSLSVRIKNLHRLIKTEPQVISTDALLSATSDALKSSLLKSTEASINQINPTTVKITFKTVGFDSLIIWLNDLSTTTTITVKQIDIKPLETVGMVQAECQLQTQ